MSALEDLLDQVDGQRPQHAARLRAHVLAHLVCLGVHTVTGLISVLGGQFRDWSAHYRMYQHSRIQPENLFDVVRRQVCAAQNGPVTVALDDTRVVKTSRKIHGVKYMRDPMGPRFRVNLVRAQRFVQISMALPDKDGQARMIPVDWRHAPLPVKPDKRANAQQWARYERERGQARIGCVGAAQIQALRRRMDEDGQSHRPLWVSVDGGFTNNAVLKDLPENTTLIGRIRADAKLYHLPDTQPAKGRRRVYGERAPTPEQLRQDDAHPWQDVEVHFGGQRRTLRAKRLAPLRWRCAGQRHDLQLVVLAPTAYRLSPKSRLLYRQPAYLICTDPNASLHDIIQRYLWRWDIEVNFRDQKTLLGTGDAQVRTPAAVQNLTATAVAAYAMLLLAAEQCRQHNVPIHHLPTPKWRQKPARRVTTMDLINNLRHELWAQSIHFSGFVNNAPKNTKPQKCDPTLQNALFYASSYT